jgi:hypothetical protein
LQIQDHHGSLGVLDDGQDGGGGCVGAGVAENQINARTAKGITRPDGAFGGIVHQAGTDDGGPFANALFHLALVALQPLFEPVELRPVCRQANPEYSHRCLLCLSHANLHLPLSVWIFLHRKKLLRFQPY